jgi:phage tail sheath gpL-like
MTIKFNNIPDTIRTPGAYGEIDPSRALTGLLAIPHKVLILGQKIAAGTVPFDTVVAITKDGLADGFFGPGSVLARMCNVFKENNQYTEVHAMALGSGIVGTQASAGLDLSLVRNSDGDYSGAATLFMMVNGKRGGNFDLAITSGMSTLRMASLMVSVINADSTLPITATVSGIPASGGHVLFSAVQSGTLGNYLDVRFNYDVGNSYPPGFSAELSTVVFADGATDPDLGDAWAVIDGERYNYIIQPWITATALAEIENELADRFEPLEDLQGHGFTAVRGTQASCTTLGNSRNSPHNTIMGAYDAPQAPEEWAAALGGVASFQLNNDPARPLHTLKLKGMLPPPAENRFTRSERDILLYDGIATWIVDSGGNVLIERCITTYQSNALGIIDPTYLDIQTLATLGELRDQWKARMISRFIVPRFKLADDGFPVQPGSFVATPSTVAQETIALFTELRNAGLIENLQDFIDNLRVERPSNDRNRVNVLLAPDLINQFRILAGLFQFIL